MAPAEGTAISGGKFGPTIFAFVNFGVGLSGKEEKGHFGNSSARFCRLSTMLLKFCSNRMNIGLVKLNPFSAGLKSIFSIHSCGGACFAWSWRLEPTFEGPGFIPKEGAGNK